MINKIELNFWNFLIRSLQKPALRQVIQKTGGVDWAMVLVFAAAIFGCTAGLLAAYLLNSVL